MRARPGRRLAAMMIRSGGQVPAWRHRGAREQVVPATSEKSEKAERMTVQQQESEAGVRFGVYLPTYHLPDQPAPTARAIADYARRAEELGFDSLWVIDHLFVSPPSYRVSFLEPLTVLAAVAAVTNRVALGTGIIVLPIREPVLLAKTLATLDAMSDGRLIFGAGVGWDQRELDACQIERASRGRRMDEILEIVTGLWQEDRYSFSGKHFVLNDVELLPRPAQRPRPPVWIAAGSVPQATSAHITQQPGYRPDRSLRRVARFGDALMSAYRSVPDGDPTWLKQDRARLDALLVEEGRAPQDVRHAIQDHMYLSAGGSRADLEAKVGAFTFKPFDEIAPYYLLGTPDDVVPKLQARIDAGVTEIAINFIDPDPGQLDLFVDQVVPRLRSAGETSRT